MSESWNNKTVVVAGGSSGLGLQLAKAFARRGAHVVLLGRDPGRLKLAQQQIEQLDLSLSADVYSVDLCTDGPIEQIIQQVFEKRGRLDVWINAAGRSIRRQLSEASVNDFRELMEINFLAAVRCSLAVLPYLQQNQGHLVNIGSLASRTAWPWVGPYAASKHALAAFSDQCRLEAPGIHCLHVCPGPIDRGDAGARYDDQTSDASAKKPGAGAPVKLIDPRHLADRIILACEKRAPELVIPARARWLFAISRLMPDWGDRILRRKSQSNRDSE